MQDSKNYSFYIIPMQHSYRFLKILFGGIFLLVAIPVSFLAVDMGHSKYILYLTAIVFLALIVGLFVQYRAWTKDKIKYAKPEIVYVGSLVLKSRYFGQISYKDIKTYQIKRVLTWINVNQALPVLRIILKNGKQILFEPQIDQKEKHIEEYLNFLSGFSHSLESYTTNSIKIQNVPAQSAKTPFQAKTSNKLLSKTKSKTPEAVKEVITKTKKRRAKEKIYIPIGIIIATSIILRIYGGQIVKKYKKNPVRDMIQKSEELKEQFPILLKNTIAQEAAIYVYTNDSTVNLSLLPYIKSTVRHEVEALNSLNEDTEILKFLSNKNKRGYFLSLKNDKTQWSHKLAKGRLDSKNNWGTLLLFDYNSKSKSLPNHAFKEAGNFHFEKYSEHEKYQQQILLNLQTPKFAWLKDNTEEVRYYFIVIDNKHSELESFKNSAINLVKYLKNELSLEDSFQLYTFNGNGDSLETALKEIKDPKIKELQELLKIRQQIKLNN